MEIIDDLVCFYFKFKDEFIKKNFCIVLKLRVILIQSEKTAVETEELSTIILNESH